MHIYSLLNTGITWSPSEGPESPPPGLIKAFIKLPGTIFFFLYFPKETIFRTQSPPTSKKWTIRTKTIGEKNYLFSSSEGGFFFCGAYSCSASSFAAIVTDNKQNHLISWNNNQLASKSSLLATQFAEMCSDCVQ